MILLKIHVHVFIFNPFCTEWNLPPYIQQESILKFRGVRLLYFEMYLKMIKPSPNSEGPDQTPQNVASDLGLIVCQCPVLGFPV